MKPRKDDILNDPWRGSWGFIWSNGQTDIWDIVVNNVTSHVWAFVWSNVRNNVWAHIQDFLHGRR